MRKIIFILAAITCYSSASALGITAITGSATPCPTSSTTYTAHYVFVYNSYYRELVTAVLWEFIQDGKVIYRKNTSGISGFNEGISQVVLSGGSEGGEFLALPTGHTEIRVKIFYLGISNIGGPPLQYLTMKTRDIFIGVPTAESISGTNICPNSTGTFTIPSLANATSYTWEVPAGWKVNGITGPVVTNQGTTVTITPCPFGNDSAQSCETTFYTKYTVKVKGSSATCGVGDYTVKTITIDHPVSITETNLGNNDVRLSASPTNLPSYQWTLDPAWYFPATGNKTLPEISFNSRGITGLAKVTYVTPCQNTYTREWWWVLPNTGGPGSPGTPGEPEDPQPPGDCEPEIPASPNPARGTIAIALKDPCGEELPSAALYENGALRPVTLAKSNDGYTFDISGLKAGAYIMRVKTASGKHKTLKFIKLD